MKFQDLLAYQKAFALAMTIFELTKRFPKEETYSLSDQIRRCSRSVCANIAEAYRKRAFPKNFYSKLTDCDAENSETQVWLEFAYECRYIDEKTYQSLVSQTDEIGKDSKSRKIRCQTKHLKFLKRHRTPNTEY